MARFVRSTDVCHFMAHLGHVGSLKFKWKSDWNYMKTNLIWFENINKTKSFS